MGARKLLAMGCVLLSCAPAAPRPYPCFGTTSNDGRTFDAGPGPYNMCDLRETFCFVQWASDHTWPPTPFCKPIPSGCLTNPGCACICPAEGLYCAASECRCTEDDAGFPQVVCDQV
jgi:hypothetical protein